jgi:DNA protecting protein DprA
LPAEPSLLDGKPEYASYEHSLLGLMEIKRLGRKGVTALVKVFEDDLGRVWQESAERLQTILGLHKIPSSEAIAKEISENAERCIEAGQNKLRELAANRITVVPTTKIPPKLKSLPQPPPWLFVQGEVDTLYRVPAVAVVGTRTPSERGRRAAQLVVRQLCAYQIVMVSGLAEGIDEEAHRSSLQEGVKNMAFLGHGINHYFPAATKSLRRRIVQDGGAVASEYLPDEHYRKSYFVERNRLQAGLADLVIPVEARLKGGTAHTVRFARTYGRPLAGIRWDKANGILGELERDGYPVFDIMTTRGKKLLDRTFQELALEHGHKTSSLALVERTLQRELQSRVVRRHDIERLVERVVELLDEEPDEEYDA